MNRCVAPRGGSTWALVVIGQLGGARVLKEDGTSNEFSLVSDQLHDAPVVRVFL